MPAGSSQRAETHAVFRFVVQIDGIAEAQQQAILAMPEGNPLVNSMQNRLERYRTSDD